MAQRRLQVVLDLDTGRYTGRMSDAAARTRAFQGSVDQGSRSVRQLSGSFDNLNNRMSTPLSKLRDYVLILGNIRLAILNVRDIAVGWVGSLMQQSAQVERLTMLMKGLSSATTEFGQNQEAQQNLRMLFSEARRTGFAVDQLADAFVKIRSGGIENTGAAVRNMANAVAQFGGTSDVMHRASIAIQQMSGKGVISMEELRQQLGEAVPTAMADMARAAGMSVKEFTDLVSKGVVQAKPALELLFREWEILYSGAGERMAQTFTGQIAQFKTNVTELSTFFTGLGSEDGGLFQSAADSLKQLNEAMQSTAARQFASEIGAGVNDVLTAFTRLGTTISGAGDGIASIFRTITTAITLVINGVNAVASVIARFGSTGTVVLKTLLSVFLAMKAVNVFQWMAGGLLSATQALRSMGTTATTTTGAVQSLFGQWSRSATATANTMRTKIAMQRDEVAWTQRATVAAQQNLVTANANLRSLQAQHTALTQKVAAERAAVQAARQAQIQAQANISTGVRLNTSIQQLKAAKSQEALASLRLAQAERDLAVSKGMVSRAAIAAKVALDTETAAIARQTAAAGAATLGQRALAAATAAGAAVMRGMAVAVNLALGPIGLLAIGLYAAAEAAGVFENKAKRALEAAMNLRNGIASLEDVQAFEVRQKEIRQEQAADNKIRRDGGKWVSRKTRDGYERTFIPLSPEEKKRLDERDRARTKEYSANQRNIKTGTGMLYEQRGAQEATSRARDFEDSLSSDRSAYLEAKARGAPQAELDELRGVYQRKRELGARGGLAVIERGMVDAEKSGDFNKYKMFSGMREAWVQANGLTDDLTQSTQELRDSLTGVGKAGGAAGAATAAGMSDAQKEEERLQALYDSSRDKYKDMIANQTGDIARLTAELSGAEGALAQFNAEVEAGLFGDALPEEIDALRAGFMAIDKLNSDIDWGRGMRQLRKEVAQTSEDAAGLWAALRADNTGVAFENWNRAEGVRSRFADKLEAAAGDPERLAEVNEEIEQIIRNLNRIDAAQAVDGWRQATEDIKISLMDEDEARQANFDREVERQQRMLELVRKNAAASTEEKMLAEQRFEEWRRMRQQQLDRENENSITKMARGWAKLGQNIDQALGGALDRFVDGMFDAQFSFKDFAVGIIKELVKIIVKAMIAYAIMSAIGMANNSAGQPVSFGDFMKGQIGAGLGGAPNPSTNIGFKAASPGSPSSGAHSTVPIGHSGALIGRINSGFASVSPDLFTAARSYHTGTNSIGGRALRPGEVPFIGMEGEAVLTEDHQDMISKKLRSKGDGSAPPVTVNVINNSGTELNAEQGEPQFDGKEMIVNVVVEAAQQQGPLRDVLSNIGKN